MTMAPHPDQEPLRINGKPASLCSREELLAALTQTAASHQALVGLHARKTRLTSSAVADGISFAIQAAQSGDMDAIMELAALKTALQKVLEGEWRPSPLWKPPGK